MSERPLRLVFNHNATGARRVESEVIAPLRDAGIRYKSFHTPTPHFESNVEAMREAFEDGDRIVLLGGDGTVSQAVNALALNGYTEAELAALAYGGFVDLSEKKARIMDVVDDNVDRQTRFPMKIEIDDEFYRYSPGYTTLGFTALAAASFASPESRARMRHRGDLTKRLAQITQLGGEYFDKRSDHLPAFHTSSSPVVKQAVTDVMLINNRQAGGIMKFPIDYGAGDTIGVVEKDVSRISIENISFGLNALAGRAPASEQTKHRIYFDEEGPVAVQTEGEFKMFEDVQSISATKNPTTRYTSVTPKKNRN